MSRFLAGLVTGAVLTAMLLTAIGGAYVGTVVARETAEAKRGMLEAADSVYREFNPVAQRWEKAGAIAEADARARRILAEGAR